MKESNHTNDLNCPANYPSECVACELFYKNFVLTGKATVPTKKELVTLSTTHA